MPSQNLCVFSAVTSVKSPIEKGYNVLVHKSETIGTKNLQLAYLN